MRELYFLSAFRVLFPLKYDNFDPSVGTETVYSFELMVVLSCPEIFSSDADKWKNLQTEVPEFAVIFASFTKSSIFCSKNSIKSEVKNLYSGVSSHDNDIPDVITPVEYVAFRRSHVPLQLASYMELGSP